ncbi:MAG TPA: CPBP family glutamic-type intramembrane protease [Pyrinomonadaceae bacterium]|nr:CPBP family glutamic-type intramembrane protease [Pyrinomonadaceae bacterium]
MAIRERCGLASPLREISLVVLCVLVAEWAVLPFFGKNYLVGLIPVCAAFALMLLSHRACGETAREVGWRIDNLWQALRLLMPPMVAVILLLVLAGWLFGSLRMGGIRPGRSLVFTYFWLFCWGLLQQYSLQGFINRRAQMVWGRGSRSILLVASVFALLHLPNLWLMVATFSGGLLWAWVYQRAPNLFALAFSHSLMTIVLVTTMPYSSLHGMRVGYGYFL